MTDHNEMPMLYQLEVSKAETLILERKVRLYHQTLKALVDKIKEVESTGAYKSVWTLAYLHGMPYDGPNYAKEFEDAELLINGDGPGGDIKIQRGPAEER